MPTYKGASKGGKRSSRNMGARKGGKKRGDGAKLTKRQQQEVKAIANKAMRAKVEHTSFLPEAFVLETTDTQPILQYYRGSVNAEGKGMPNTLQQAGCPRYVYYGNYCIAMELDLRAKQGLAPDYSQIKGDRVRLNRVLLRGLMQRSSIVQSNLRTREIKIGLAKIRNEFWNNIASPEKNNTWEAWEKKRIPGHIKTDFEDEVDNLNAKRRITVLGEYKHKLTQDIEAVVKGVAPQLGPTGNVEVEGYPDTTYTLLQVNKLKKFSHMFTPDIQLQYNFDGDDTDGDLIPASNEKLFAYIYFGDYSDQFAHDMCLQFGLPNLGVNDHRKCAAFYMQANAWCSSIL